ncbi:MAG: murein L,D-transpeptidase family protein [Castellaniella sp.]|uniref:L,D-transpeptidase family protein n=1 Tax=Castellaniella sp. TaxID=1955812 RepID=UPI003A8C6439
MSHLRARYFLVAVLFLVAVGFFYTRVMARVSTVEPPALVAKAQQADRIIVSKADKTLYLFQGDTLLKSYRISMGRDWDAGPKQREGDERTPEGSYTIDWRNPRSVAYLSLHISYPDARDRARAQAGNYSPGGAVMIHGLPNGWGALGALHQRFDWTDGCLAVTNEEMREIWSLTPNGTPIDIHARWTPQVS